MKARTAFVIVLFFSITASATDYWLKIAAGDKIERSRIAEMGISIEAIGDDYVSGFGDEEQLIALKVEGRLIASRPVSFLRLDFPKRDARYHNYKEMNEKLEKLASENPLWARLDSIGQSVEKRKIPVIHITDFSDSNKKPGLIIVGGHHAREHLSIELPIKTAEYLIEKAKSNDPRIVQILRTRDVFIVPVLNPDGAEFDIATGRYRMWRKNRRINADGSVGVDLNRNYGFQWGTGGSSGRPNHDTYMGPQPFSEPETQAFKEFVEEKDQVTTLLSLHTFSELVLYPWGHSFSPIASNTDHAVFEKMAKKMSGWNGYKAIQGSDLYKVSGNTIDWAYGVHRIFGFTLELDPKNMFQGGFYPGAKAIDVVFRKNIEPILYLLEFADNPYRVNQDDSSKFGFNSPILKQ